MAACDSENIKHQRRRLAWRHHRGINGINVGNGIGGGSSSIK